MRKPRSTSRLPVTNPPNFLEPRLWTVGRQHEELIPASRVRLGQGLLFASVRVLGYGIAVWVGFHPLVLIYEEPTLRKSSGPTRNVICLAWVRHDSNVESAQSITEDSFRAITCNVVLIPCTIHRRKCGFLASHTKVQSAVFNAVSLSIEKRLAYAKSRTHHGDSCSGRLRHR